ncbi:arginine N-succinyltransferase [Marinobacter caseinilyticus]|uniref:arginine N-succinyltransferase n=1 Tax=Marinobacter caseinilyticus TaxID=2692195 RepID=UPI00140A104D|nr:arginine N-succinyltransferase [Marinobacter caseinilyticus]
MWVVRPAQQEDLSDIVELASVLSARVSSTVPKDKGKLAEKIDYSKRSLAGDQDVKGTERMLFVLVNTATGKVQGTAGIDARAGNGQPFYNYRQDALIHASHELKVSRRVEVLYPSHALTDRTLLCSLMIAPELRGTDAFELLSRSRLLFVARQRAMFANSMVVEVQGVQTESGSVPFWDSLGRHFFNMDFATADSYSGMLSKTFIAELMPPNPIYVDLLSEAAQAALGQPHDLARKTFELLEREGFQSGAYVDIFDGGPVLEARTDMLKTIVSSLRKTVRSEEDVDGDSYLAGAGEGLHFRCGLVTLDEGLDETVKMTRANQKLLACAQGDELLVAPL